MKRQSLLKAVLTTALIVAGCATTTPYNPFKIPAEEIHSNFKTIALSPVAVPGDIEDPNPIKAKFESLIQAKLREAGFSVVPSAESAEIFSNMNKQLGGIFDPVTGQRDETKFKAAKEHALRELSTKFKADAVLYSRISAGTARFSGGKASWGGTSESVSMTEGFLGALQVGQLRGNTTALSLVVSIENINGGVAYVNTGGIQLAAKISGGQFVPVPRNQLFASEERVAAAVNYAFAPLVRSPAPAGAPKAQP
jgi:hypothetical protein